MYIKSIVAAATFALIAGVGSVSADELSVADTAVNTGTAFDMLDGIATEQLSVQELGATRGAFFNPLLVGTRLSDIQSNNITQLDAIAPNNLTVNSISTVSK